MTNNSKLSGHKLTRNQRRNHKKAVKRKLRRYDAALWGSLTVAFEMVGVLNTLTPKQAGALRFGSLRERKQAVEELNFRVFSMKADPRKPNPVPTASSQPRPPLPIHTHEFVDKGGRWRLHRREGFELW